MSSYPRKALRKLLLSHDVASSPALAYAATSLKQCLQHAETVSLLRGEDCSSPADKHWLDEESARFKTEEEDILRGVGPEAVTEFLDSQEASSLSTSALSRHGAMVEVRQGVGGEEAALWTHSLVDMYTRYAAQKMWSAEILDLQPFETTQGNACRSATLKVMANRPRKEDPVYARLKFEAGVHRVKRIPVTERSGRIHTSTATVMVLPLMSASQPEFSQVQFSSKDVVMDTFKSSGKGGQHANTTDTAVRLTHVATGLTAKFSRMRSQEQNRKLAEEILHAKLLKHAEEQALLHRSRFVEPTKLNASRSSSVRTYHFLQSYVTDHRIPFSARSGSIVEDILAQPLLLDEYFLDTLMLKETEDRLTGFIHSAEAPDRLSMTEA